METTQKSLGEHYLEVSIKEFKGLKKFSEKAIAQLSPKELHWSPDLESNSIVIIIKHLAGNMISRWTDFLTTDGEKSDRNRDGEFIDDFSSYEQLMAYWEKGWQCLFDTLSSLTADDLQKIIYIRGEAHSVIEAIHRQLTHYGSHVGQIIYLAKQIKSTDWKTLSIPRGKSAEYLQKPRSAFLKDDDGNR